MARFVPLFVAWSIRHRMSLMKSAKNLWRTARILSAAISLFWTAASASAAHLEEKFDALQTRTGTYRNVTVTTHGRNSIFIMHSTGMATIFLTDLSPEIQQQLGYTPAGENKPATKSSEPMRQIAAAIHLPEMKQYKLDKELEAKIQKTFSNPAFVIGFLGGLAFVYLFVCFCLMLICKKTGNEPGILIWLPVLQIFPMLRAAGMSGAWFLAYLIPGLNILAQIIWCFKIVAAREKSVLIAIMLLLPILNLFAFLYLAFSDGSPDPTPTVKKEKSDEPAIVLQTA